MAWQFVFRAARVFCGLHFPLDIAGSLGVAVAATTGIYLARKRLEPLNAKILHVYDKMLGQWFKQEAGI